MKSHRELSRGVVVAVLLLLIGFHLVNTLVVLSRDVCHLSTDTREYYSDVTSLLLKMRGMSLPARLTSLYFETHPARPPLFSSVASLFLLLFGMSQDVAALSVFPFFALAIVATFLIGRRLFDTEVGLVAAVLFSFFPGILAISRIFRADMALIATTGLSLYFLLKSENLSSRRWSLLFGATLGLAALSKTTYVIFQLGPLLVLVVAPAFRMMRKKDISSLKPVVMNALLVGAVVMLMALPWHVYHFRDYSAHRMNDVYWVQAQGREMGLGGFPHMVVRLNPFWLMSVYLFMPVALLFWASVVYLLFRKRMHRAFLLTWMLFSYLGFALIGYGDHFDFPRLVLPILPAAAITLAILLVDAFRSGSRLCSSSSWRRAPFLPLIVILCALEVSFALLLSYGSGHLLPEEWDRTSAINQGLSISDSLGIIRPCRDSFDLNEVVDMLEEEWAGSEEPIILFHMGDSEAVSAILWEVRLRHASMTSSFSDSVLIGTTCKEWHDAILYNETWSLQLDYGACLEKYTSSQYAFIEPRARLSTTEEERAYRDTVLVPLIDHIRQEIDRGRVEVLAVLPPVVRLPKHSVNDSFAWLNESIWILKRV